MTKNILIAIAIALVVAVAIIANIRFFSGEDDRICQNGKRIKHGNPSVPMPTSECK